MGRLFCTHPTSSIRVSVEPERDLYEEEEESGVLDCIQKKKLDPCLSRSKIQLRFSCGWIDYVLEKGVTSSRE